MEARRRRRLVLRALAVLTVPALAAIAFAISATRTAAPDQASDTSDPTRLVVLGDSYMEGIGATSPTSGMASLIAGALGYDLDNLSTGGTGYLDPGRFSLELGVFADRIPAVAAADPDVLVVAGGYNDWEIYESNPDEEERKVRDTLAALKAELPDTTIHVVGPFWPDGSPVEGATDLDAAIRTAAADLDLTFVSPIGERWITGNRDDPASGNAAAYIGPDGIHPTPAGHEYLAAKVAASLAGADR